MGSTIYSAYDQIATILAKLGAEGVMKLKASDEMQVRMEILLQKSKDKNISIDEKDQLNHFVVLERLVRITKIKAYHPEV